MLKKLSAAAITTLGFLSLATPAFAVSDLCPRASGYDYSILCKLDLTGNFFGSLITIIFVIATILALIYLIYGGIKWVLSGGDKTKVDAARSSIVAAIVGLIIVFLAYFILNVVVGLFIPGFSLQTVSLPSVRQ